jgi:tRNA (guanine-N7-)-methyltransferase
MNEHAPGPQNDNPLRLRAIRSFVLRQGRQTEAQKRAFVEHWPKFGLDYRGELRDFEKAFGRSKPLIVEVGFGNGEQLLYSAGNEPERDLIGIEVHGPGVGRLLNGLAAAHIGNVRVYQHDAVEVLKNEIADAALDEVRIYFPDPWHKKRHHKRRLVQPEFVALLCAKLKSGGRLHLATDWQNYAEQMREVCAAEPRLHAAVGDDPAIERPHWRRQTHFENRGLKLGHGVTDLLYRRH